MSEEIHNDIRYIAKVFLEDLHKFYHYPLFRYLQKNSDLLKTFSGFLLNPSKLIIYIGKTHIAVEYVGVETIEKINNPSYKIELYDYSDSDIDFVEKIIGFKYDSTVELQMSLLPGLNENYLLPTNKGFDKLMELQWNFHAQDFSMLVMNASAPTILKDKFSRIVNGFFFDADELGLKTRHIKWLDFIPITVDESDSEVVKVTFNISYMKSFIEHDATYIYPLPNDYKFKQLPKINRFIEIWGNKNISEPEITNFLSQKENKFILTMKFGATDSHAELTCKWQSEERDDIRPDFFIVQPNGYADIVEFKLPHISKNFIVGRNNRESFSSWLNSYISQTRVYVSYFDDPNNRKWFEEKYGFKVHKPKRWLVVGRRYDFSSDIWREIVADYRDLEIITFDDLVDGVVVQFYQD